MRNQQILPSRPKWGQSYHYANKIVRNLVHHVNMSCPASYGSSLILSKRNGVNACLRTIILMEEEIGGFIMTHRLSIPTIKLYLKVQKGTYMSLLKRLLHWHRKLNPQLCRLVNFLPTGSTFINCSIYYAKVYPPCNFIYARILQLHCILC